MIIQSQREKLVDGVTYEVHTVLVPTTVAFAWSRHVAEFNKESFDEVSDYNYGMAYMDGPAFHHVT